MLNCVWIDDVASKYPNVVVVTDDEVNCLDEFKVNTVLAVPGVNVKEPDDNVKPFEQVNKADIPVAPVNVFADDPVWV